jgi:thiamine-monophosphate kinase
MNEFELIARYFDRPAPHRSRDVRLGIGDDCALLAPRIGHELAISTDMLVADRHFFDDADSASLGWKTLAVNLSDLAAMGARPLAFTLAVALPTVDEGWLAAFSGGLFECADAFDCELIGGDTTRGPLTFCVTVFGEVVEGRALRRAAAKSGDDVWISGSIGAPALALRLLKQRKEGMDVACDIALLQALDRPVPRVALGLALSGVAHAAIDLSDGLAQDLGHILAASKCGAELELDAIPIDAALAMCDDDLRYRLALTGGDDYELCFTAAASQRHAIEQAALVAQTSVTRVGRISDADGLRIIGVKGEEWRPSSALRGFDHFA